MPRPDASVKASPELLTEIPLTGLNPLSLDRFSPTKRGNARDPASALALRT